MKLLAVTSGNPGTEIVGMDDCSVGALTLTCMEAPERGAPGNCVSTEGHINEVPTVRHSRPARPRAAEGFTLIEILVTLVIISVGLLGIAGLHSMSLRNNFDALIRSHASALADEIADRMRTNRARALAGDYQIALGATRSGVSQADADLIAWKSRLASQLPNGDGSVSLAAAPSRLVTITIQWGERSEADPVTFVTQTEI